VSTPSSPCIAGRMCRLCSVSRADTNRLGSHPLPPAQCWVRYSLPWSLGALTQRQTWAWYPLWIVARYLPSAKVNIPRYLGARIRPSQSNMKLETVRQINSLGYLGDLEPTSLGRQGVSPTRTRQHDKIY